MPLDNVKVWPLSLQYRPSIMGVVDHIKISSVHGWCMILLASGCSTSASIMDFFFAIFAAVLSFCPKCRGLLLSFRPASLSAATTIRRVTGTSRPAWSTLAAQLSLLGSRTGGTANRPAIIARECASDVSSLFSTSQSLLGPPTGSGRPHHDSRNWPLVITVSS